MPTGLMEEICDCCCTAVFLQTKSKYERLKNLVDATSTTTDNTQHTSPLPVYLLRFRSAVFHPYHFLHEVEGRPFISEIVR